MRNMPRQMVEGLDWDFEAYRAWLLVKFQFSLGTAYDCCTAFRKALRILNVKTFYKGMLSDVKKTEGFGELYNRSKIIRSIMYAEQFLYSKGRVK